MSTLLSELRWIHNIITSDFGPLDHWELALYKYCILYYIIITRFWETAHLPLPQAIINTYFSLRAKCWLKGGVGGQFP